MQNWLQQHIPRPHQQRMCVCVCLYIHIFCENVFMHPSKKHKSLLCSVVCKYSGVIVLSESASMQTQDICSSSTSTNLALCAQTTHTMRRVWQQREVPYTGQLPGTSDLLNTERKMAQHACGDRDNRCAQASVFVLLYIVSICTFVLACLWGS